MEERLGYELQTCPLGKTTFNTQGDWNGTVVQLRNDGKTLYNTILSYDRWLSLSKHRGKGTWLNGAKWMAFQCFGFLNKYKSTWLKSPFCLKTNRETRGPKKRIPTWTLQKNRTCRIAAKKAISLRANKLSLIVRMVVALCQSYFLSVFVTPDHLLIGIELKSMENKIIQAPFS